MDTVAVQPKYSLNQDQEKKLIIREYRALLRSLKPKLKPGDKELIRLAFEMAAAPCFDKADGQVLFAAENGAIRTQSR